MRPLVYVLCTALVASLLLMIVSSLTGCQSRYYPPAPKYEGYILK